MGFIEQSGNERFYFTGIQIEVSQNCALREQNQDLKPLSLEEDKLSNKNFSEGRRSDLCFRLINKQLHWPLARGLWRSMCFRSLLLKKPSVVNAIKLFGNIWQHKNLDLSFHHKFYLGLFPFWSTISTLCILALTHIFANVRSILFPLLHSSCNSSLSEAVL